jgi:hypothetical protein
MQSLKFLQAIITKKSYLIVNQAILSLINACEFEGEFSDYKWCTIHFFAIGGRNKTAPNVNLIMGISSRVIQILPIA